MVFGASEWSWRLAMLALFTLSCAGRYREFERNLANCRQGRYATWTCEQAIVTAPDPARDETIRTVADALLTNCTRGNSEVCVLLGREHLGLSWSDEIPGWSSLLERPDPAMGVSLLSRACPLAEREQARKSGSSPLTPEDREIATRACQGLVVAAALGRGMPRDWDAALRFARLVNLRVDPPKEGCSGWSECSIEELAMLRLRKILQGATPDMVADAQAAAHAALDAGLVDEAAVHFLRMVVLVPPSAGVGRSEKGGRYVTVTPEMVPLATALWPVVVERELAAGRIFSGALRAQMIFTRLKRPDALAGQYRAAIDAATRPLPSSPSHASLREELRYQLRREILGDRPLEAPRKSDMYGRPPPPRDVRWLLETSEPACAFVTAAFEARHRNSTGSPTVVRLENARCERSERRWEETAEYVWHRRVGGGYGGGVTQYREVTRYASTNSGCGADGRLSCAYTYTEKVPIPQAPATPVEYRDERVMRTVAHRAVRFRVQGQLVTAGRAPVPLDFVRDFDESAYEIPEPHPFSAATMTSLTGDAVWAVEVKLRELAKSGPSQTFDRAAAIAAFKEDALEARAHGDVVQEDEAVLQYLFLAGANDHEVYRPFLERYGLHIDDVFRLLGGKPILAPPSYLWESVIELDARAAEARAKPAPASLTP